MIEFKDLDFFNHYFGNLKAFRLVDNFKRIEQEIEISSKKREFYSGTIEAIDTIHPLLIQVEIPISFPHHKLTFRTTSLHGYPHLIYNASKKSSWFCLNTPFSETAEDQLNLEISRLTEWIERQMSPDLIANISDPGVISALRKANAYEWENPDEMEEYNEDCLLTFIGNFAQNSSNFDQTQGIFNCVRNKSGRFYILENKDLTNCKLPFVVVDSDPEDLSDLVSMIQQYGWDNTIIQHLLPNVNVLDYECDTYLYSGKENLSVEESFQRIDKAHKELIVPEKHFEVLNSQIDTLKEKIIKNKGPESLLSLDFNSCNSEDFFEEEILEYQNGLNYFALGVKSPNGLISWLLCTTSNNLKRFEETTYDLDINKIIIKKPSYIELFCFQDQRIPENNYFGRGKFTKNFTNLKVAIIGLGAIGSMLAESLVRSGVKVLGLWDNDSVQPGNICRSTYTIKDLGENKILALASKLSAILPSCKITKNGCWYSSYYRYNGPNSYNGGDFYSSINYTSQADTIKSLDDYDLVIDCTASNEILHFLSYALVDKHLISLCITNHAKELVCVTNRDENPFDLRKHILSKIEQDTKNLYTEGTGCYSPTFYAKNCDIAALVNLVVREMDVHFQENKLLHSTTWSYTKRGVTADEQKMYVLESNPQIKLSVSSETLFDGEDLPDTNHKHIGYLLGGYNHAGTHIYLTHMIASDNAQSQLIQAFEQSHGIIDYIGDYSYSWENNVAWEETLHNSLANKASNELINTNNPLLATRNTDGTISFYLYINDNLSQFVACK